MSMDLKAIKPSSSCPRFEREDIEKRSNLQTIMVRSVNGIECGDNTHAFLANTYKSPIPLVGEVYAPKLSNYEWNALVEWLKEHGLKTKNFSEHNDGDVIPESVCIKTSRLINKHFDEFVKFRIELYPDEDTTPAKIRDEVKRLSDFFSECGGCEQW